MKNIFTRFFDAWSRPPQKHEGNTAPRTTAPRTITLNGSLVLPKWARAAKTHSPKVSICIEADTAGYVAEWFKLLKVGDTDQYWLEVAYQCAKLDLQAALVGTEFDPRTSALPAEFHFSRASQYEQKNFPQGRGIAAATRGREAREHYRNVRGSLPM
jgi:hypothetical protein